MVIGEIFLTAFIQVLFGKLASRNLWNFGRRERVHTLLTKWKKMLEQIEAVLADAENKQMTNQEGIRFWLEDLEDLAYDLDDVLDEFATEALRRKVTEEPRASNSKILALVPTCCTSFNPRNLAYGFRVRSQIDEITSRLQDLLERRIRLGLQNAVVGPSSKAPQRPHTSSLIHEPCLYGRDGDKRALIELLLSDQSKGLIQKLGEQKQMEDLGCGYFHELLSRMEKKLENNEGLKNITKARHSSYTRGYRDVIKKLEIFQKANNLRSFLPFGWRDGGTNQSISFLTSYVPLDLLPSLRRLRVLSLRRYRICEVSSLIGDLKHVRFLDLSCALIVTLPESIGILYNLQTLILRDCKNLSKLPASTSNLINLRHLDVTGAYSLKEMPPKIGKLTCLRTLSNFIVSQGNGSMIKELGNLIHLRGTLYISGLENVVDALDAMRANLKDKQGLDVLLMKWSNISNNSRIESVESEVLDMLRPHKKLKELTINGYHGLTFPTWVGNSLFSNMVCLKFQHCEKCIYLPPLGQLASLTKLHIQGMKAIKNVGLEFYGLGCSNSFPALEILTFEDMPEWEGWSPFGIKEGAQAFARLLELSIKRCPKLLQKLPSNLPCLRKLDIHECPLLLVGWVPSSTKLNDVRNTLHFDSLISLSLTNISLLNSLRNPKVGDEVVLENGTYSHLSSLTSLRIDNVQGLECLPNCFFHGLTELQELSLSSCKELTSLWKNEVGQHHHLPAFRRFLVKRCTQLTSIFEEEQVEEEGLQQHEELPYLMMLEYLKIEGCGKLEKLPRGLLNIKYLQELIIHGCPCLISFPKTGLPSTLRTLDIDYCDALSSLPELVMLNNLEKLMVSRCPSLTYLCCSGNGLPPTLKDLYISSCGNLECIIAEEGIKINCPSLESVVIWDCESLKSLPDVMPDNNGGCLSNLSKLHITECDNVESVPEGWFTATKLRVLCVRNGKKLKGPPYHAYNNLTCLQDLRVNSCTAAATGLVSYLLKEESSFSCSHYFTNLTCLSLWNVDMEGKPPSKWGLHILSSLRQLFLMHYGWASFPPQGDEGMMLWLPPSLIKLTIGDFTNLEKLSCKECHNMSSLEQLDILRCPKLTTITELGQLPSLSELSIWNCPNLASFSAEEQRLRLPPSLLHFWINECPILKQSYEKRKLCYASSGMVNAGAVLGSDSDAVTALDPAFEWKLVLG
ncbi:hypothetical protein RHSIM_Rhsim07G0069600 [Rhododendron simsii]|uniref:Rx N-terminal domain-containing protein n=1 Tax=Rhododendron simsii TaxID=118357 RepID=A0A834GLI7_RHOSS|nr:hypothetical protein RHSIM_Rhsim07G0069600 [Rhododendron simsii]